MDGFQEDLKNHYEQGWKDREDRIIRLLEAKKSVLSKIDTGHGNGNEYMSIRIGTIDSLMTLIKEDN